MGSRRDSCVLRHLEPEQEEELLRCIRGHEGEAGVLYFFRNYVVTFDEVNEEVRPFPMWDFQVEYLLELEKGGKILVEKPRDMMITWTTALYELYKWIFCPGWTGFCISRQEKLVDDGGEMSTTKSILGRIRFTYNHLPEWMRPRAAFTRLKILNLDPGMETNTISGEATKSTSGQSVACSFKWADELSQVDQSEQVHASMTGGGFQTLVYSSISNLMGNAFGRLRHDPKSGFRVLTFQWWRRPDRDQAWYDMKASDLDPISRATQLDIVYDVRSPMSVQAIRCEGARRGARDDRAAGRSVDRWVRSWVCSARGHVLADGAWWQDAGGVRAV
jgi:hypothetical protein